ncbi:MAG: NUDIX hydrolase [Spirochaetales bacterium]|nr:NUDIX hydrolase [Spirochaetales bacterium]
MEARQFFIQPHRKEENIKIHRYCPRCGEKLENALVEGTDRSVCAVCGFIQYLNPSTGVVVLLEGDGRILLGRRCGRVLSGRWSLPGGYINFDEDFLSAAHREVLEETGFHIRILSILSVVTNVISSSLHTLVIVLRAEITGGAAQPGDDLDELMWISAQDSLPEMAFESDRHIIRRFFDSSSFGAPVDPRFAGSPYNLPG